MVKWTVSSEFGTYHLCEQRRFRRACASSQSRQNLRCSLIQALSQEEPSDRKPDAWPLWMAGHAQLKFVMTECSKTQIRLTELIWCVVSPLFWLTVVLVLKKGSTRHIDGGIIFCFLFLSFMLSAANLILIQVRSRPLLLVHTWKLPKL